MEDELPNGLGTHPMQLWLSLALSQRIRGLSLRDFPSGRKFPIDEVPRHLPRLRELLIIGIDSPMSHSAFELPSHIHGLSRLTRLSLRYYHPPWNSEIFSDHLVYLKLGFSDKLDLSRLPTLAQFQAMISRLSALESLTLENVHPQNFDESVKISLPASLRLLEFRTRHTAVKCALQSTLCLRVPATCSALFSILDDMVNIHEPDVEPKVDSTLMGRCISNIFECEREDDSPHFEELIFNQCTVAGFVTTQPRERWLKTWYATPNQYETAWEERYSDPYFESPTRQFTSVGKVPGPGFFQRNVTLTYALAISFSCNLLEIPNALALEHLAVHATKVRRVAINIPSSSALSLLHRLAENLWSNSESLASDIDPNPHRPPLFPLLETLVIHARARLPKKKHFIAEWTALTNLVLARKQSCSTAPLQEVVVSQSTVNWAVWDTLRDEVPVTFF